MLHDLPTFIDLKSKRQGGHTSETHRKETAHPCLTTDWILGQFGARSKQAEERYREFVYSGIGKKGIWAEVKGQSVLGEDKFAEEMAGYVKGARDMTEIPITQRYLDRPKLEEVISEAKGKKRDEQVVAAVERYGYTQREVAKHLGLHYSTISRMLRLKTG